MTDLEKAQERVKIAEETFAAVQAAASKHRKLTHDKHHNGHFTKALDELSKIVLVENSLMTRLKSVS